MVAGAAVLVRLWFLAGVPEMWTLDSRSYLRIALKIARDGSFADPQLGVLRLPGYPVFLACVKALFGRSADALLVSQAALGIAGAALGLALGRVLFPAPRLALILGLFLALNPASLALEHAVMSEALATFSLILASFALLLWARRAQHPGFSALAGAAVAACILVRLNGALFLGLLAVAALAVTCWSAEAPSPRRVPIGGLLAFALALGLSLMPWILRNASFLGHATLFASPKKVALVYAIQHGLVDPSRLPVNAGVDPAVLTVDPSLVTFWRLLEASGPVASEAEAAAGIAAASRENGRDWRMARVRAFFRWTGLAGGKSQLDLLSWFSDIEIPGPRLAHARTVGRRLLAESSSPPDAARIARLAAAVGIYLAWIRPALFLAGAIAAVIVAWRGFRHRSASGDRLALGLALAYGATAVQHGWMLADYSRFAIPFDWVLLAVVLQALGTRSWTEAAPEGAGAR